MHTPLSSRLPVCEPYPKGIVRLSVQFNEGMVSPRTQSKLVFGSFLLSANIGVDDTVENVAWKE